MIAITAPVKGKVVPLSEVPDPVFANSVVGPGVAIIPVADDEVQVQAPISGILVKLHPHAFVIAGEGANALVHLGIDTVKLSGAGFTMHVEEQEKVAAGQPMITWNPKEIRAKGYDPICPVVALEAEAEKLHVVAELNAEIAAGAPLLELDA